jgi:hypothetical protein
MRVERTLPLENGQFLLMLHSPGVVRYRPHSGPEPLLKAFPDAARRSGIGPPFELVVWRNITNRAVQSLVIVFIDIAFDHRSGILRRNRASRTNAFFLPRLMPTLQLAVALRIKRRGTHMGHTHQTNIFLEVLGDCPQNPVSESSLSLGVYTVFASSSSRFPLLVIQL